MLSYSFNEGLICGLPELFFDIALLWHPAKEIARRQRFICITAENSLPSWSWAGWCGKIDPRSWSTDYVRIRDVKDTSCCQTSRRIHSLVQRYCGETLASSPKRLVPTVSDHYRKCNFSDPERLPQSWSGPSARIENIDTVSPEGLKAFNESYYAFEKDKGMFYRHECDSLTKFWYPIPICGGQKLPSIRCPEPILFSQARRA